MLRFSCGTSFWEKEKYYCQINQQEDRKQDWNLSPQTGLQYKFYELGEEGWYAEAMVGQVSIRGFGTWPFGVSYVKGL